MDTLSMIMAGDRGERLMPLTLGVPKPLVRFGSNGAIIDYTLYNCLSSGAEKTVVLTGDNAELVDRYLRVYWNQAFAAGGKSLWSIPRGGVDGDSDAEALYRALSAMEEVPEHVLLLSSDHVYRMDYREMIRFHEEHEGPLTVGVTVLPDLEAGYKTAVMSDEKGRIRSFHVKPGGAVHETPGKGATASMGIYAFNAKDLMDELEKDRKRGLIQIVRDMIEESAGDATPSRAFLFNGSNPAPSYWREIDNLYDYWRANMDVLAFPDAHFHFSPLPGAGRLPFPKREMIEEHSFNGRRIIKSCISGTAEVGAAEIVNSVIGPGVTVEDGAVIKDSVILDGAAVRSGARILKRIAPPLAEINGGGEGGLLVMAAPDKLMAGSIRYDLESEAG